MIFHVLIFFQMSVFSDSSRRCFDLCHAMDDLIHCVNEHLLHVPFFVLPRRPHFAPRSAESVFVRWHFLRNPMDLANWVQISCLAMTYRAKAVGHPGVGRVFPMNCTPPNLPIDYVDRHAWCRIWEWFVARLGHLAWCCDAMQLTAGSIHIFFVGPI